MKAIKEKFLKEGSSNHPGATARKGRGRGVEDIEDWIRRAERNVPELKGDHVKEKVVTFTLEDW